MATMILMHLMHLLMHYECGPVSSAGVPAGYPPTPGRDTDR